jgi:small subunit ribosomal protein S20
MANHISAIKRIRQNEKRRVHNKYYARTMRNALRAFRLITDKKEAADKLSGMTSTIDKLAKRGIIHKNKAANLKSKLSKQVSALS